MALFVTEAKKKIGSHLNIHQQETDKKIVGQLQRGSPHPY
jgi:hypothetical protein